MSQYHYDDNYPTFILCGEKLFFSDSWMANGDFNTIRNKIKKPKICVFMHYLCILTLFTFKKDTDIYSIFNCKKQSDKLSESVTSLTELYCFYLFA